jgi:hypothetical protein
MPLNLQAWQARLTNWATGQGAYLPFDDHFKPDNPLMDNHLALSQVGTQPDWYIFVEFSPLDPQDQAYPHYIELYDNNDFVTFRCEAQWSGKAGLQHGRGPVPTEAGKHHVRLVLLNKEQSPILSQSGDYYVDFG